MLTHYWVVLLQTDTVWVVTTVLLGYICKAGARGGLQLDDWTYVLILGHLLLPRSSRHEQQAR